MPVLPPAAVAIIYPSLLSVGMIGTGTPNYALGIATGLSLWVPTIQVSTIDTGTFGVGVGLLPLVVPPPLLIGTLTDGYVQNGLYGPMAAIQIIGLATGIAGALALGIITTAHPTVGVGTGVATFTPPPATPFMLQGFAAVGITGDGPTKNANAIGTGLMEALAALILPVPIVGSPAPAPSGGVGKGSIL